MAFALETQGLEKVDLTTLARVKELIYPGAGTENPSLDAPLTLLIGYVSAEITRYLGFHTLVAERTETYEMVRGKRVLSLDARPITVLPTAIKVASHPSYLATASDMSATDYVVHPGASWIKFNRRLGVASSFVQLTYTAGLGLTADDVIANHGEIALAAGLQVKYMHQRRDSLGGNISTLAGANTQFTGQYGLLREVRNILGSLRRASV